MKIIKTKSQAREETKERVWKAIVSAMGGDIVAMRAGADPERVLAIKEAARQFASDARKRFKDLPISQRLYLAFISGVYWQMSQPGDEAPGFEGPIIGGGDK